MPAHYTPQELAERQRRAALRPKAEEQPREPLVWTTRQFVKEHNGHLYRHTVTVNQYGGGHEEVIPLPDQPSLF